MANRDPLTIVDKPSPPPPEGRRIARHFERTTLTPAQMQERSLVSHTAASKPQIDAFREVRTRLLAAASDLNIITLVAPVSRGSGGSFVARNLAATFAFDESKHSLLLDCDLFQPSQQSTMRINAERGGLIDYLENPDVRISDVLYDTGIPRLRVIPAGSAPQLGVEYFSSFRMRLMLDSLRSRYPDRYLFLDSPPVRGAPDARILSDLADVVVLVAGYGRDSPASIAQAAANFDPNKFAGVVFNEDS
ncbi:MAG: polysaccharide biosynthesis protein [Pseudomonadota bacterium]|nr:polysaccharide biosynthesis protein [Pseudomonadota bacterium]